MGLGGPKIYLKDCLGLGVMLLASSGLVIIDQWLGKYTPVLA